MSLNLSLDANVIILNISKSYHRPVGRQASRKAIRKIICRKRPPSPPADEKVVSTASLSYGRNAEMIPYALNPQEVFMGRGILLWLLGVPIPVIILLALIWH